MGTTRRKYDGTAMFGELVRRAMAEQQVSQTGLAGYLTKRLPEGRYHDASTVRLLQQGRRRVWADELELLVPYLHLRWGEVWRALGVWPEDLSVEGYESVRSDGDSDRRRRQRAAAAQREPSNARNSVRAGQPIGPPPDPANRRKTGCPGQGPTHAADQPPQMQADRDGQLEPARAA
jgi:hypothetical protein